MIRDGASPFSFPLSFVPWQVFGSLTFKGKVPSPRKRYQSAWQFLRRAVSETRNPYSSAMIALREEQGEQGGRHHFHFLLAVPVPPSNMHTYSFRLRYWWKQQTGGMSQVVPFDSSLPGVNYLTKGLSWSPGRIYEVGKFGLENGELMLSEAVKRWVRARFFVVTAGRAANGQKMGAGLELRNDSPRLRPSPPHVSAQAG